MLTKPKIQLNKVTNITPDLLKRHNINCLILDVDNTICINKGKNMIVGANRWLLKMKAAGIKLIILSNAKPQRMGPIAQRLDLPMVALGLKPLPFGYFRAAKKMDVSIKNCAIVGDQLLTDILGGNLAGVKTILVTPTLLETSRGFKIKRAIERKLLKFHKLKCNF